MAVGLEVVDHRQQLEADLRVYLYHILLERCGEQVEILQRIQLAVLDLKCYLGEQ